MKDKYFETSRDSLCWASEAIDEIKSSFDSFGGNADNLRQVTEIDPNTGYELIKVKLFKPIPSILRRRFTEALNNIRHSFDQSIYGACWAIGKRPKDSIHFPWATSPTDLDMRLIGKKTSPPKIAEELWPVLRGFKPYGTGNSHAGGDDLIREMAKIANRKHTVKLNLVPSINGGTINSLKIETTQAFHIPVPRWDPVKNEVILFERHPETKADYDYTINFYIAFDEPGPLNKLPAIGCLELFLEKAKNVCDSLMSEVDKIGVR